MELSIGRVKLKVSFAFTVLLALLLGSGDTAGFGLSFACCCIHELLHLLLFLVFGAIPRTVTLTAAGIRMDFGSAIPVSLTAEAVCCALPAVFNAVTGIICAYFYSRGNNLFLLPAASNLVLGIVNLLPARALDGGRAIWCLISSRFSPHTADTVLSISEYLLLPLLIFAAVHALVSEHGNISVTVLCVYVVIMIISKKYRL